MPNVFQSRRRYRVIVYSEDHRHRMSTSWGVVFKGMEDATPDELGDVGVEGAGYTLTFPRLDEDFGLRGLIERFGTSSAQDAAAEGAGV